MTEKNHRQMEELKKFITKEKGEDYLRYLSEREEKSQRMAFLDGYMYAIRILEEGLVNIDKK